MAATWQTEFNHRVALVVDPGLREHFAHGLDPDGLYFTFEALNVPLSEGQTDNGAEFDATVEGTCVCGKRIRSTNYDYAYSMDGFMRQVLAVVF